MRNINKLNLLILEDNPYDAELMVNELEREGFSVEWKPVNEGKTFKKALATKPDLILADYRLPSFDGMQALKIKQQFAPEIPFVIVSGSIGEELAVECIKAGATDYVLKDSPSRLGYVVKRALNEAEELRRRKHAEEALRESNEKYHAIVENSHDAIYIYRNKKFLFANGKACELSGYSRKEFYKMEIWDFIHPDDRNRIEEYGKKSAFRKKTPSTYSGRVVCKNGDVKDCEFAASIISYNNRNAVLGIARDITRRKRIEEKLNESEKRLDLALKGTGVGMWDWNIKTDKKIYSERWAEIIGYTLEELSSMNIDAWTQLTHPQDRKISDKLLEKHFAGETEYYISEVRMKHKNGNWIWLLDRGKVFEWDENGKPIRMVGTHLDITEHKKVEKERERMIKELKGKLKDGKIPDGFLPICASCHKIRDEQDIWHPVTDYLSKHTNLEFSHGMCPDCIKEFYGENAWNRIKDRRNKQS
jgi:PAS domain S-box-containing protein